MATEEEAMPPIVRPIPLSLPPTDILPLFLPPTVRPTLRGEGGPSSLPHSRSQREQFQHCSRLANVHPPPPPPALKNFLGAGPFRGGGKEERRGGLFIGLLFWGLFLLLSRPEAETGWREGEGPTDLYPLLKPGRFPPLSLILYTSPPFYPSIPERVHSLFSSP